MRECAGRHYDSSAVIIPEAQKRGMAVLGMKPLANGGNPEDHTVTAPEGCHYAMSAGHGDVTAAIRSPCWTRRSDTRNFSP